MMTETITAPQAAKRCPEWQNMVAGEPYDAGHPEQKAARERCRSLYHSFNTSWQEKPERDALLHELLGGRGDLCAINPPFFCDYGANIFVGENFYANVNCTILDVCEVHIGDNVLLAPGVQIYTAAHPGAAAPRVGVGWFAGRQRVCNNIHHPYHQGASAPRVAGVEYGKPVRIGNNVWIGGSVVICPGVTIGDNSVIGAGSVVTRDIPAGVVAVGNPCRVLRPMTAQELAEI